MVRIFPPSTSSTKIFTLHHGRVWIGGEAVGENKNWPLVLVFWHGLRQTHCVLTANFPKKRRSNNISANKNVIGYNANFHPRH